MVRRVRNETQKAARAAEILRLREQGLTLRTIGERVGLHHTTVRDILLEEIASVRDPLVGEIRHTEAQRLYYLREKLAPDVNAGDVKAITEDRKISESLRRLYGADGPVQVSVEVEQSPADRAFASLAEEAEAYLRHEEQKVYGDRDRDGD